MRNWYAFAKGRTDGNQSQRDLLGGKGANLAEMCNLGISVPPGFTLPTPLCQQYYDDGSKLSDSVLHSIDEGLHHIEKSLNGPKFGDAENPLLVSVRSGARVSMPGMMDTVLNIGLTECHARRACQAQWQPPIRPGFLSSAYSNVRRRCRWPRAT